MRTAVGYLSAALSLLAVLIYVASLSGSIDVFAVFPLFWALNIAAVLAFVGSQFVLLPKHRDAKLNVRVLKHYLAPKQYQWLILAFWVCLIAMLVPIAILPKLGFAAPMANSVLSAFAAGWTNFFFIAATMLLSAKAPKD
jgi:uncharacterized membrane protein